MKRERFGGGKGIRTPGLLIANETLYQLSYTPRKLVSAKAFLRHALEKINHHASLRASSIPESTAQAGGIERLKQKGNSLF
jgi:hypothetical protein